MQDRLTVDSDSHGAAAVVLDLDLSIILIHKLKE